MLVSNDAFSQSEEPTDKPQHDSTDNPSKPAPLDIIFVELDETGPIDPLVYTALLNVLGISPSELTELLELAAEVMTPLPRLDPYIESLIAEANAAGRDILSLLPMLPYSTQGLERIAAADIARQNRAPFADMSENARRRRAERFQAVRGGANWHPRSLGDVPINLTSDQGFDPRDSVRRVLPYAPQLSELITLGNTPVDPSSYTNGLTPQDYQQAADNGNMLAAWQAGTNRARADFAPYVEDVEPTDDESTTNPE